VRRDLAFLAQDAAFPTQPAEFERRALEVVQYALRQEFSREMLAAPNARLDVQETLYGMGATLVANLLEDPEQRVKKALRAQSPRYPADWWQAVKEKWAPRWFLRRWPVRWAVARLELEVDLRTIFPTVRHIGEHKGRMVLEVLRQDLRTELE
jgi:hypothetical protein